MQRLLPLASIIFFGLACSDPASNDAGPQDSGPQDSRPQDSGPVDVGVTDQGQPDAAAVDMSIPDTGPDDSGPVDMSPPDTGPEDTGSLDGGPADAGDPDGGNMDAAVGVCGDGIVDSNEACDFGLQLCCNATCDGPSPSSASCRGPADVCDAEEFCNGLDFDCPLDVASSTATLCRAAVSDCDAQETCDGVNTTCPVDGPAADGLACTDCLLNPGNCATCLAGVCQDDLSSCRQLLDAGLAQGDGIYTIFPLTSSVSHDVYCDMTTDGGGWTMVFKKSTAVASDASFLFTQMPANPTDPSLLSRAPAAIDYASAFHVAEWPRYTEARLEVLTGTITAHFVQLNIAGSAPDTWLAPDRHTASSWTDLPVDPNFQTGNGRFFSVAGSGGGRRFYLNRDWGGCSNDRGWLMVSTASFCSWENGPQAAEIHYALGATIGRVIDRTQFGLADSLIVFVR